ncbi:hypothetical protein DW627_10525 [Enterococcus faecium]|nr:hypothetical protein [Enterococcus faecium]EKZ0102550.1 hypothetical protein [Enterococcus faecium]
MIPKFRAWDRYEEAMTNQDGIYFGAMDHDETLESLILCLEERYELMQSTGLKDKNGVEIFEGDIVAVENHPFQRKEDSSAGMEIEGDYVVGWNQHDLTWCAGDLLLARLKPYVRIIGNIYENSELLEEE